MDYEYTWEERMALDAFLNDTTPPRSPSDFRVYKNGIYNKDMTKLYGIIPFGGSFEVPDGVKRIKGGTWSARKLLSRLIIPESVVEIEEKAFERCDGLEYADIHAQIIGSRAFCSCNRLQEIKLHEGLQKIGDQAFAYISTNNLILPPGVQDIGHYIMLNAFPFKQTLEVYLNNGALPKTHGLPADVGTLFVIRSPETDEKVCEFVILGKVEKVFTPHGIDFTEYDKMFRETFVQGRRYRIGFRAARTRIENPYGMDEDTRRFYEEYIADAACYFVLELISRHPDRAHLSVSVYEMYSEFINDKGLMKLIDASAMAGMTELTAFLMQKLHEMKSNE